MSDDLQLLDAQLFAREPFQIVAAARAAPVGPLELHPSAALAAAGDPGNLDDLQLRPGRGRTLAGGVETEAQRVGQHRREAAHLEHDAEDGRAVASLGGDLDHLLRDPQLVHQETSFASCSTRAHEAYYAAADAGDRPI